MGNSNENAGKNSKENAALRSSLLYPLYLLIRLFREIDLIRVSDQYDSMYADEIVNGYRSSRNSNYS